MHLYSRPLGATLEPRSLLVAAMAKSSIMPKITKHLVEAAEIRDKHYTITDSQIPGFGIRIMRGGTRTYVVMYRAGGRRRRMGLGHHGVTTPEQARTSAINILARVRNGEDPAASRQGGDHITTVTDLAERFDEEHIAVRLKPKSAHNYRLHLRAHILPALSHFQRTTVPPDIPCFPLNLIPCRSAACRMSCSDWRWPR